MALVFRKTSMDMQSGKPRRASCFLQRRRETSLNADDTVLRACTVKIDDPFWVAALQQQYIFTYLF